MFFSISPCQSLKETLIVFTLCLIKVHFKLLCLFATGLLATKLPFKYLITQFLICITRILVSTSFADGFVQVNDLSHSFYCHRKEIKSYRVMKYWHLAEAPSQLICVKTKVTMPHWISLLTTESHEERGKASPKRLCLPTTWPLLKERKGKRRSKERKEKRKKRQREKKREGKEKCRKLRGEKL